LQIYEKKQQQFLLRSKYYSEKYVFVILLHIMSDTQLKVLFLSSWYPTKDNPTMGNFVQKHAEAVALFAKVTVLHVCFSKDTSSRKEMISAQEDNLNSHIVYLKKSRLQIPVIREIIKLLRIVRAYYSAYKSIYQNDKPDIIHANILIPVGLIAYLFFKTKKIPYIITEHWTGYLPGDPNKPGRSMFFFRYFANKASTICPVTQNLADGLRSFHIRNTFKVIPNVVDTFVFNEKGRIKNNSVKHILHISSLLDVQKNFSGILMALQLLKQGGKDFILEVISDGDFEQYTENIEALGLNDSIIFHGRKNTSEVATLMKHCDLLLLFSKYENFPCVIPEAWASGLPVISTDVGGIAEYLIDDNGVLLEVFNIKELAHKLENIFEHPDQFDAQKIREYAVRHFSYDVVGSQFINLYQLVLKR
jgi:L-malate glycosyltransferase